MKQRVFFRLVMATTLILLMAIVLFAISGRGAYSQMMGISTEKALEAITQELEKLDPTTANAADLVSRGRQISVRYVR
jgi:uncharacterized protein YjfI (DUF2170 family)